MSNVLRTGYEAEDFKQLIGLTLKQVEDVAPTDLETGESEDAILFELKGEGGLHGTLLLHDGELAVSSSLISCSKEAADDEA